MVSIPKLKHFFKTTSASLGTPTSNNKEGLWYFCGVRVVSPTAGQVDDLLGEIRDRAAKNQRVLITTLTKRMAEDLTDYLAENEVRVRYLHSEIHSIERIEIIQDLRLGEYDVLVGVNLLREGLDLPEVSLVCILDADKQGFLRSTSSLIQTMGRAARNANSTAIMYADKVTPEMQAPFSSQQTALGWSRCHLAQSLQPVM